MSMSWEEAMQEWLKAQS